MSIKCTEIIGKTEDEPSYFHVWRHCFTNNIYLQLGNNDICITEEDLETLKLHIEKGFIITR